MFEAQANQDKALQMARYMRNQFIFYGLPTPQRKQVYKEFLKQEKKKKCINWSWGHTLQRAKIIQIRLSE